MNVMTVIGIGLIAIGLVALIYQGITYTTRPWGTNVQDMRLKILQR